MKSWRDLCGTDIFYVDRVRGYLSVRCMERISSTYIRPRLSKCTLRNRGVARVDVRVVCAGMCICIYVLCNIVISSLVHRFRPDDGLIEKGRNMSIF